MRVYVRQSTLHQTRVNTESLQRQYELVDRARELGWAAEQVRVANAAWSKEPYMIDIRRLACRIDLHALLQGRLVLPMIELVEPA